MRRPRRLPRTLEREVAKLLNTLGFADYGQFLWNLSAAPCPQADVAPTSFAPAITNQILDQARHDPALVAMGHKALPFLPQDMRSLFNTWGVSASDVFDPDTTPPAVLFVVARLDTQTSTKLATLIGALGRLGADAFMIVIAEQSRRDVAPDRLKAVAGQRLVFWRDLYNGDNLSSARLFATFIHAVGAVNVVSFRCRLGLETIGFYGCALKCFHRLFARLEVPAEGATDPLTKIYYLRLVAPHATVLAETEGEADLIRSNSLGLTGPGVTLLSDVQVQARDALAAIFGETFHDGRSEASRHVIPALLRPRARRKAPIDIALAPNTDAIDITVTIVFHRERDLAVPALASLSDMIEVARQAGLRIESRAMLDKGDDVTRGLVAHHGGFLDESREVAFGDLALTRNAGAAAARGRFSTFLDGDDLWGSTWLLASYRAATSTDAGASAIWHPEAYFLFHASDCTRRSDTEKPHERAQSKLCLHPSSRASDFDPRDLLLESLWTANSFAATEVYRRFPYRPNDWSRQIGIEDWRFHLETLAQGFEHLVVPDTVHMIRVKDGGSLGQLSDAKGLLPLLL